MISKSTLFRQHHFLELLRLFDFTKGPLDVFISLYFRNHPQLGSKDRLFIVERIYTYFRWKLLIEALIEEGHSLEDLVGEVFPLQPQREVPAYIRVSFPEELYQALQRSFGEKTSSICLACNEKAPITLRANLLKTTRASLIEKLRSHGVGVQEVGGISSALTLDRRLNMTSFPEFKEGLFEIQDAGSQKVADFLAACPGDLVLDYCAGAGGKTLAFAHRLQGKGQIFLHDVRKNALEEAKKRLRRAGVQNIQCIHADEREKLSRLKGKMDWVLLDVPCTGTGTLRRSPDIKWKFSEEMLASLVQEQRAIFTEGISYVKPGGYILYATCSLLREENEEQLSWFLEHFPVEVVGEPFSSIPTPIMDGFFAVRLHTKGSQVA